MSRKLLVLAAAAMLGCSQAMDKPETAAQPEAAPAAAGELQAVLQTTKGTIVCRLFPDRAPETVANFVGLAEGTKEFTDPRDGKKKKARYYDGLVFFRVIPGFMIQGGDPLNKGYGGPGYQFKDEFDPSLRFDRPGLLAMANAGPGTNGSQFFITDRPRGGFNRLPSHLNDRHTIFGEVIEGLDVVSAIADGPTRGDKAVEPVAMTKVEIKRLP